jgi:hypothetical protein
MSAQDHRPVGGEDSPKPDRTLNDKELAARRANSQKSTGPRSLEGKARVRVNAVKHGAYARDVTCISEGPLAESPDEVEAFYAAVLEDLDPQSPVQWAMARDIASLAWRQQRADDWENLALAAVETAGAYLPDLTSDHTGHLAATRRNAAIVLDDLDRGDFEPFAYEDAASTLYCALPDGTVTPEWDPDRGVRPSNADGWRVLIERLISLGWSSREEAASWARADADATAERWDVERRGRAQLAARAVLVDGVLDKAMNMSGRLRRDFIRMLEQYREIRHPKE